MDRLKAVWPKTHRAQQALEQIYKVPEQMTAGEQKLYLLQSRFSLPSPFEKTSPVGTHEVRPLEYTPSWPTYLEDIEEALSFHVVGFDAPAPVDPGLFKAAMRAIQLAAGARCPVQG